MSQGVALLGASEKVPTGRPHSLGSAEADGFVRGATTEEWLSSRRNIVVVSCGRSSSLRHMLPAT